MRTAGEAWRRMSTRRQSCTSSQLLKAAQGSECGQAYIADFYEKSKGGLAKDLGKALELYRLAAAQGNDFAIEALRRLQGGGGRIFTPAKQSGTALRERQGSAEGLQDGGAMVHEGSGGRKYNRAVPTRAVLPGRPRRDAGRSQGRGAVAAGGRAEARGGTGESGLLLSNGKGRVGPRRAQGVSVAPGGGGQGNSSGQANLGLFYDTRKGGLARDEHKALALYQQAATQGNATGIANLAYFYEHGKGGRAIDYAKARFMYEEAEEGQAEAQASLGRMYDFGRAAW